MSNTPPSPALGQSTDQQTAAVLIAALDNLHEGFAVFDRELKLLAWNERFASLPDYPGHILEPGQSLETLLRASEDSPASDVAADAVLNDLANSANVEREFTIHGKILRTRFIPLSTTGTVQAAGTVPHETRVKLCGTRSPAPSRRIVQMLDDCLQRPSNTSKKRATCHRIHTRNGATR